ncbi:hypothetical protein MACH10_37820 [Thalassospira tepidiphila]|uniref:hypothetical protein n=1 Tax=Thalassospira tepidiphila TaxID=393657 RepID=UPI00291E65E4|nr:hypothetical protein MACH10_37820 [Thalassospira tepidiphila]
MTNIQSSYSSSYSAARSMVVPFTAAAISVGTAAAGDGPIYVSNYYEPVASEGRSVVVGSQAPKLDFLPEGGITLTRTHSQAVSLDNSPVLSVSLWKGSEIDETLTELKKFRDFEDGWDGDDSLKPKLDAIEDALAVLQYWHGSNVLGLPIVEPDCDGNIIASCFDEDGYVVASIDFIGDKKAVFVATRGTKTLYSKVIDAEKPIEILGAYESIIAKNQS